MTCPRAHSPPLLGGFRLSSACKLPAEAPGETAKWAGVASSSCLPSFPALHPQGRPGRIQGDAPTPACLHSPDNRVSQQIRSPKSAPSQGGHALPTRSTSTCSQLSDLEWHSHSGPALRPGWVTFHLCPIPFLSFSPSH